MERKGGEEENHEINICARKKRATYSDLVIVALVLHVLIKLFLRVKLNPAHLKFLPYLQHKTMSGKNTHPSAVFKLHYSNNPTRWLRDLLPVQYVNFEDSKVWSFVCLLFTV